MCTQDIIVYRCLHCSIGELHPCSVEQKHDKDEGYEKGDRHGASRKMRPGDAVYMGGFYYNGRCVFETLRKLGMYLSVPLCCLMLDTEDARLMMVRYVIALRQRCKKCTEDFVRYRSQSKWSYATNARTCPLPLPIFNQHTNYRLQDSTFKPAINKSSVPATPPSSSTRISRPISHHPVPQASS
jgi:hypothetical protein